MNKLLRANFTRLIKDKVFIACLILMALYAIGFMGFSSLEGLRWLKEGYVVKIESYYFSFIIALGGFAAFLTSLFIGTDYNDGTIRNKLIVGHTRVNIYLANLITNFTSTLLLMVTWLILALIALPFIGPFTMGIKAYFILLSLMIMISLSYAGIFTLISMLSGNKTLSLALSIIVFVLLLILSFTLINMLDAPEFVTGIQMTINGMEFSEPSLNPRYVTGITRDIYQWIIDILPTGQALQIVITGLPNILRSILSSLAIAIATTLTGIILFNRKDLK